MEYEGKLFEKKSSCSCKAIYLHIQTIMGKVVLSGMHPIGHILNFEGQREFQNGETEHMHAPIHILDAPKYDQKEDRR